MELESLDEHWCIILKNYFFLVYDRYKVAVPCEADWCLPQLPANTSWLIAVEAPRMLIELGEINEDTRIPAMISLCEDISEYIDEYNYLPMYSTTVNALLHDGPSLGKMIVFCAFSAGYCVYLCNHNMNDHSVKEVYKAAQSIFQSQFKSWLDNNDGWVSSINYYIIFYCHVLFSEHVHD